MWVCRDEYDMDFVVKELTNKSKMEKEKLEVQGNENNHFEGRVADLGQENL